MKKLLTILMLLICTVTAADAAMTAAQRQSVIAKINKSVSSISSMICDFTQTKTLSLLNDRMVSSGKMYYKRANKLRWEYESPYKYLFVFNGAKVYVANKSRKDVIDTKTNKLFKEVARIMMSTVTGTALSNSADFTIGLADASSCWQVTLVPKKREMKKMFSKIMLVFKKSDLMISEINIYEKNNDKTNIKLRNITINGAVNENLFAIPK